MIDKFCDFVTRKIRENVENIDEERAEIIEFGIRMLFGETPKIIVLLLIGFLLQVGWYTVFLFFMLAPYRSFTGGVHLKTHLGCMITTTILYILPIILAKNIPISNNYIIYIMISIITILSAILIWKYAPSDTEDVPILSKKERRSKKIKSYISLTVLMLVAIIGTNKLMSMMLVYGIFIQNLTIIPIAYKITNSKYGYKNYTEETI